MGDSVVKTLGESGAMKMQDEPHTLQDGAARVCRGVIYLQVGIQVHSTGQAAIKLNIGQNGFICIQTSCMLIGLNTVFHIIDSYTLVYRASRDNKLPLCDWIPRHA